MKESPRPIGNSFFARETCWGNFGRKSMKTESGQRSDIGEGDHVLLNKTRDNKLSPNFEPVSYKVVEKKGNVILKKDQEGNTKLCNSSHIEKFI